MKPSILLSVVVLALVASAQSFAQAPRSAKAQDVKAEFEQLKRDVTRLTNEVQALKAAKGPDAEEFDQVLAFMQAQAESAGRLKKVLAESEQKGFTYGINPDSRIILLAGFNDFASTLESAAPTEE